MHKFALMALAGAAMIGTAQAQYYDRPPYGYYERPWEDRGGYRPDYREVPPPPPPAYRAQPPERHEARRLMECAGYVAQMRTYRQYADMISPRGEERAERHEEQFTRESDRLSGADPARHRWFQSGVREAQGDIARNSRYPDEVRREYWRKVRECRDYAG